MLDSLDSDARMNLFVFSIKCFSKRLKFSIDTLMNEIQTVVSEKLDFKIRNQFIVEAVFFNI